MRSGCPSHQGGLRMRLRCGWPRKPRPNMSHSLALVPVGRRPEVGDRVDGGRLAAQRHLEAHVGVPLVGEQVVEDGEVGLRAGRRGGRAGARRWRRGRRGCANGARRLVLEVARARRGRAPPGPTAWGCRRLSAARPAACPGSARAARARPRAAAGRRAAAAAAATARAAPARRPTLGPGGRLAGVCSSLTSDLVLRRQLVDRRDVRPPHVAQRDRGRRLDRPASPTTQLSGRRSVWTWACSSSRPSMSAVGAGGQPCT